MTHRNYIVIKAAGDATYPFTEENGWYKILEFQTNSPSNTTFDPAVTTNAEVAWDYGDGYYATGAPSVIHTYADSTTKTVKLYLKGSDRTINSINLSVDNIVGVLDLRHDAFKPLTNIQVYSNPLMTGLLFPSTTTGILNTLSAYSCNLTGTFDYSMFTSLHETSGLQLALYSNVNLTSIIPPTNPSGKYGSVQLYSTGLSGEVDLTNLVNWTASGSLYVHSCPVMTGLKLASAPTGTMVVINIHTNSAFIGNLDISGFVNWTTAGQIGIYGMPNMTSLTTPSASTTGLMSSIQIMNLGITTLNLTKFTKYTTTASLTVYNNPSLASIQLPETVSGTFQSLYVYNNPNLTGTLDLSKFDSFITANAYLYVHQNTRMSGVIFASTITGTFAQVRVHNTGIVGVLDLTMFKSFSTTTDSYFIADNNPYVTQILLALSITGTRFTYPSFGTNPLMTSIDMAGFQNGFNSVSNCFMIFSGCALPASVVNKILYDINSKSVSGYSNRTVALNAGTNAAPDSISGGYDGIAAKAALIAKGISVSTN